MPKTKHTDTDATSTDRPSTATRMPAAERRQLIITAAIAEFSRHGLSGASTKRIAAEVGVSEPYLYRLFATKKELFLASGEHVFETINDTFRRAATEADKDESPDSMWAAFGPSLEESAELFFVLQFLAAWSDPEIRESAARLLHQHHELLRDLSGETPTELWRRSADGLMLTAMAAVGLVPNPSAQPFALPVDRED